MIYFTDEQKKLIRTAFETTFNRPVSKLAELNPAFKSIFDKCGIVTETEETQK